MTYLAFIKMLWDTDYWIPSGDYFSADRVTSMDGQYYLYCEGCPILYAEDTRAIVYFQAYTLGITRCLTGRLLKRVRRQFGVVYPPCQSCVVN